METLEQRVIAWLKGEGLGVGGAPCSRGTSLVGFVRKEAVDNNERLQFICDLASARLANLDPVDVDQYVKSDLEQIVEITGKVWMLCRKQVTLGGRTCVSPRGHKGPCVDC